jgi:hypothetical protein
MTHSAGLGSSLYGLGEDPIENTASKRFSIVMGRCLAIARISKVFTGLRSGMAVCLFAYCIAAGLYATIQNLER